MPTPRGKIGRLTEAQRKQINGMIRDNKPNCDIVDLCRSFGAEVTEQNVSAWKKWGYQKWEVRMKRLDDMEAERQWCRDVVTAARGDDGEMTLESDAASLRATQILRDALDGFDPNAIKALLSEKPGKIVDLIHALSSIRLRDQASVILEQKVTAARQIAGKLRAQADKSSNEYLKQIADEMDAALGG